MTRILYLPLDERPCNYRFPFRIAKMSKGYSLIRPCISDLGDCKKPANHKALEKFIFAHATRADIAVLSFDMLLYGGIVPSRLHHLSIDEVNKRLEIIKKMKELNPSLKIYIFSLILRCPRFSTSEEEPDYYGVYGEDIFRYGEFKHKYALGLISKEEFKTQQDRIMNLCGKDVVDFENRRKVNKHAIINFIDNYYKYVDYYVIPQDDSAEYGYTTIDREEIKAELKARGISINMYPGADEVGMVLVAKAIRDNEHFDAELEVVFPKPECEDIHPLYEDRKLRNTLMYQLDTIGFKRVNKSNVKLYMNYPTEEMVNMGSAPSKGYEARDLESFVNKMRDDISKGYVVSICDGAYGNGGEDYLLKLMDDKFNVFKLAGYAGWNTSSNSLGTVLAMLMMVSIFGENEYKNLFLAERFYEDIGYCGVVRWPIWHDVVGLYGYSYETVGYKNGVIAKIIKNDIIKYFNKNYPKIAGKYAVSKCETPWRRIFEVDLTAKKI